MKRIPRIGFVSMGCPKALVDSERIMTQLRSEGYDLVGSYHDADLVIVNTCGFLNEAVAESVEAIEEAMRENGKVIVTGCLGAKRHLDGTPYLTDVCPGVVGITGPGEFQKVYDLVHSALPAPHSPWLDLVPKAGLKLTPSHYAYLKISEGCNHHCTFCIIPQLRGKLESRPVAEIMREARLLKESGVKELMVISQDTSAYGMDKRYGIDFTEDGRAVQMRILDLCKELGELGIWVRLHYMYPYAHVDRVVELMAEGKILPYLDVPFQHAHPRVLKAMKRPAAAEETLKRIQTWRKICPDLTIRSTFIAGFPGETEDEFQYLLDFLKEAQLDRVGCFAYSPIEGAAANELPGALPDEVREERRDRFMQVQSEISAARLARKIGTIQTVIIDEPEDEDGVAIGRTMADAPEIDGIIYVTTDAHLKPGDMVRVKVTANEEYDLVGRHIEV